MPIPEDEGQWGAAFQMTGLLLEAEELEAELQRNRCPLQKGAWQWAEEAGAEGGHCTGGCLSPAVALEDQTLPHSSLLLSRPLSKSLAAKGPCQPTKSALGRYMRKMEKEGTKTDQSSEMLSSGSHSVIQEEPSPLHLSISQHRKLGNREAANQPI